MPIAVATIRSSLTAAKLAAGARLTSRRQSSSRWFQPAAELRRIAPSRSLADSRRMS
jgi:hypothetical protein